MTHHPRSVHIGKNYGLCLEYRSRPEALGILLSNTNLPADNIYLCLLSEPGGRNASSRLLRKSCGPFWIHENDLPS